MREVVGIALAASVGACGPSSTSNEADTPRAATFAELKRAGFSAGERRVVGLTDPTQMPNGSIAEGSPLFGFTMTKGTETFECRVPMDQRLRDDQSAAEMANWPCIEAKRG